MIEGTLYPLNKITTIINDEGITNIEISEKDPNKIVQNLLLQIPFIYGTDIQNHVLI